MEEILNSKFFGVVISLGMFQIGRYIFLKTKFPICNPLLIAAAGIIIVLKVFNIPLKSYMNGGGMIEFFLAPATTVLVVPLYRQIDKFKKYYLPILVGGFVGSLTTIISVVLLGKLFNLDEQLIRSFSPQSITTPVGLEASLMVGGIPSLTVFSIIVTGITGYIVSPFIFKLMGNIHPIAKGVGIGVSSHAVGTSKAIEMGEVEGAMSALSIVIAGIMTILIIRILLAFN
ncbi:MAG: LrgB family protein [Fusobacteriaceae bacterium]